MPVLACSKGSSLGWVQIHKNLRQAVFAPFKIQTLPALENYTVNPGRGNGKARDLNAVAIVFLHALPRKFYEEIMHSFLACAIVDCTPGPGEAALATVCASTLYTGICFSETHRTKLKERLVEATFEQMQTDGSPLYNAGLVSAMAAEGAPGPSTTGKPKPKPKPKPKRARTKPKPTAPTNDNDEGEGEESDPEISDAGLALSRSVPHTTQVMLYVFWHVFLSGTAVCHVTSNLLRKQERVHAETNQCTCALRVVRH